MHRAGPEPAQRFGGSRIPQKVWPQFFVAIAALCLIATDTETIFVTAPLAVGLFATLAFFWTLWCRRDGMMPWFELGAVYVTAVVLYMAYPLVGYLALGQTYTLLNDNRLAMMQPDAAEVGQIGWLYVCHLVAFGVAYLLTRGRLVIHDTPLRRPGPSVLMAAAIAYLAIEAFQLSLGFFFDMSASTYIESFLVSRRLPLFLAQLLNHLSGIQYPLSLMLLAALFERYQKYRPLILAWLLLMTAITLTRLGSRTDLVLLVMSAAMMYHALVRPLPSRVVLSIGVAGLVGFLAFGVVRGGGLQRPDTLPLNPFAYASEFETLFANAVHLNRQKDLLGELPVAFYLADLGALIPQQIAPFTKVDRGDWYVSTFFPGYAAAGGGYAFGTIAEAILTGGWIGALAWGAALGVCFAKVHRFYARHADRFWVFVFYVWITTLSYQSFRNGTFALLVYVAYRFLPALLAVNLLAHGLKRATRGSQPAAAAAKA